MATKEGENQQSGNHTRPDWVAMWGRGLGQPAGIVAMSHPANFRSPQHVRLHPKKPYFCFLPMVERPLELKPKVPYVSRFRLVAFDGKLDTKKVGAVCKQFQTSGK